MKRVIILLSILLLLLNLVLAYDPNYPILGGRIRNVCGGTENDPNCVNTCDVYSGSCYAPSGYTVSVYKCKGIAMRPGTPHYECINLPGYNFIYGEFGLSSASLANYVEPCTTIQIDVVNSVGEAKDWIVWVSDRQSPADCNPPTPTPPPTTTLPYGSLKIFKFYDSNGNGQWDYGEQPLQGFAFTVIGPITTTVYTNADGYALLTNLPYGYYIIRENVPDGWQTTTSNPQYVTINSPLLVEVKFGNKQVPQPPCTTTTICPPSCYDTEDVSVGSIEVSPYTICRERDATIEISVPVRLVAGRDDTEVTARFYIKEDGRYIYIGKDTHVLDVGERKTFSIEYEYNAYDLSYGTHDIKVVVEGAKDSETRYSAIRVIKCFEPKDIDVGFIWLNPENPRSSDLVEGKVPITLKEAPSLPQNVYVEVRIDGKVLTESSLRFYHIETKEYKFYFSADKYGEGMHTIEVTAWLDGISDTSMRRFIIDESSYFKTTPEHCLIIKDLWTEKPLKEGETATLKVRVRNCGMHIEPNIETRLYALNKTMSGGIIMLKPNEERDVSFVIRVPEDTDIMKVKVNVWNPYASDELEREFSIKMGYPQVRAESEYVVRQCQQTNISFIVKNVGEAKDMFTISFEGEPAKWLSNYPSTIELDAGEFRKVYVDVNVPCDASGLYKFTITAQGSPKYSVTSTMRVKAENKFNLLWLLLLLPLLLLLLIALLGKKRNKKPERCMGPHGC
ncbi:MAG: SpaA isopeptide-forming pilin-related protein [Candidatus Aenigmatarchaeota archaeon]